MSTEMEPALASGSSERLELGGRADPARQVHRSPVILRRAPSHSGGRGEPTHEDCGLDHGHHRRRLGTRARHRRDDSSAGGGRVVLLDLRDVPRRSRPPRRWGRTRSSRPADVTSAEDVTAALEAALKRFGAIHGLVNCAGVGTAEKTFGKRGPADLAKFARTIQINLIGTFNCIRLAAARHGEEPARTPTASAASSSTRPRSRPSTVRSARPRTRRPRAASSA